MSVCRYSSLAHADLEEIALYIQALNPVAANHFVDEINDASDLLAEHPQLGRKREELGDGLRSFPVGNYLIFYSIESDDIFVSRIIYGARNLREIFRR
jgi:toxin ParE1/3/4